jgi:hypothetical protein
MRRFCTLVSACSARSLSRTSPPLRCVFAPSHQVLRSARRRLEEAGVLDDTPPEARPPPAPHAGLGLAAAAAAAVRHPLVDAAGSHDAETAGPTPAPCLCHARSRARRRRRRAPGAWVFVGPFVRSSSATQQVCPPLVPLCFVNLYSDLI